MQTVFKLAVKNIESFRPMKRGTADIICVIPARGGSKGIPGKNLKVIAGKSLLAWSIQAAQESCHELRTIVSTDSESIAHEARRCGADVRMRPAEISGDSAGSESALLHVLESLAMEGEPQPRLLVFLQCTSPLTRGDDIDATIDALRVQSADCALAVAPFHYFLWKPGTAGWESVNHEKSFRPLRQERVPEFIETGAVYVMKVAGFLKARHRFFGKIVAAVTPPERRWEIDDPKDLVVAEQLIRCRQRARLPFVPRAIIFDFDGVMTDNKVYVSEDGKESVRCDRSDGMGVEMMHRLGIPMVILSKEVNPVVDARSRKLKLEIFQGVDDKRPLLERWATEYGLDLDYCAYLGNDLNDIDCLNAVGISVAVADACPVVKQMCSIVLRMPGGQGAVREFCDIVATECGLENLAR